MILDFDKAARAASVPNDYHFEAQYAAELERQAQAAVQAEREYGKRLLRDLVAATDETPWNEDALRRARQYTEAP